ncbi:aminotransferase DegT [Belnapia sp. T18]|uniref:Aminotransferase DegT n=1 Tax=Belnapia arida TaxID=2804533 RepID=A0ABS1U4Y1_9PROT|nr:aminotransferase DegT [Belnapia arida]MBL6079605.1 aminotransferase DegT [Belnapia arida]
MNMVDYYGSLFIGGGPAGIAPLVWAARTGRLKPLANKGLVVVEAGNCLGAGSIGSHAIGSDTLADTFLECLESSQDERLSALRTHPSAEAVRQYSKGAAPLPVVAAFLETLGRTVQDVIEAAGGQVLLRHRASGLRQQRTGQWVATLQAATGETVTVMATKAVLATGATQRLDDLASIPVAGLPLMPEFSSKLLLSGAVLGHGGVDAIRRHLRGITAPRIAIVGGSHSAVASANRILYGVPELSLNSGSVTILHRRPLRIFYPTPEAALAEGYTDFGPQDVCAVSGRLYRLAGFRLDARDLVMRALGVGGRPAEPRLALHRIGTPEADEQGRSLLQSADLIVAALGYRPTTVPVEHADGTPWRLAAGSGTAPLVNSACEVLDNTQHAIPGLYGIGLAAGFVPQGAAGGEPSFIGQTNGLWLWQNPIGAMIVDALLQGEAGRVAA